MLASFGVLQVFWSLLWFFLFLMWIMTVFRVFGDILRSPDLSGGSKAIWTLFVIFLPFLGVISYLIVRGNKMAEHQLADMKAADESMREYIRNASGTVASPADELSRLAGLRDAGAITDDEFARLKARIIG